MNKKYRGILCGWKRVLKSCFPILMKLGEMKYLGIIDVTTIFWSHFNDLCICPPFSSFFYKNVNSGLHKHRNSTSGKRPVKSSDCFIFICFTNSKPSFVLSISSFIKVASWSLFILYIYFFKSLFIFKKKTSTNI